MNVAVVVMPVVAVQWTPDKRPFYKRQPFLNDSFHPQPTQYITPHMKDHPTFRRNLNSLILNTSEKAWDLLVHPPLTIILLLYNDKNPQLCKLLHVVWQACRLPFPRRRTNHSDPLHLVLIFFLSLLLIKTARSKHIKGLEEH